MSTEIWSRSALRAFSVATALAVAVAVAACGDSDSDDQGSSGGSNAKDEAGGPYKIGMFGGFTGFLAAFDNDVYKGAQLRASQLNAEGGIDGKWKIELSKQDSASDPAKGRLAASQLLDDGAEFLIGTCAGDASLPGALLAAEQNVPVIPSCAGDSAFPKKVGPMGFLGLPGGLAQGSALGEYAVKQGLKKVFVVGSNENVYVQAYTDGFKEGFTKAGGEIVGEEAVQLFKPSYAPAVQKLEQAKGSYDAIFTPLFVPDSPKFIRAVRAAGIDVPLLLDDGNANELVFAGGNPGKAVIVTNGFEQPGSRLEAFDQAWEQKYGKPPFTTNPAIGATIIDLIASAVTKAGTTDPEEVAAALNTLKDVETTTVPYTYEGHDRVPRAPVVLMEPTPAKGFKLLEQLYPAVVPSG